MDSLLDCKFYRRFGVEIELNLLEGALERWDRKGYTPASIKYLASVINKKLEERVDIQGWDHVHDNDSWIIKPDMSCGLEINSPVLKGWTGLKRLISTIEAVENSDLQAGLDCSLHVHVNVGDLNEYQLASVIAYYIKCEHLFFDSVPIYRKNNRYCQCLGITDLFSHDSDIEPFELIQAVSRVKYYSLNAYHFMQGGGFFDNSRKPTLEFRIAENEACTDPFLTKNWIRLLLHFVECTKDLNLPDKYREGDPWTSLLWLDLPDFMKIMNFNMPLSKGLEQTKAWFLSRLWENGTDSILPGLWSNEGRSVTKKHLAEMGEPPLVQGGLYDNSV